jgi:hypothetical protein
VSLGLRFIGHEALSFEEGADGLGGGVVEAVVDVLDFRLSLMGHLHQ